MSLLVTLRIAIRALAKNKMRAGLTVLGVVIGIAAVTAMVSVGQSASSLVQGQFEALGTNVIMVTPASKQRGGVSQGVSVTLTVDDARSISKQCSSILAASPVIWTGGQAIYGNANWKPNEMYGVGEEYLAVRNWSLRSGGFFTEREVASASKVCVLGQTLVAKLFQTTNPLGKKVRIQNVPLEVIGVLEEKGANLVGDDQDDVILIPVTTVQKRLQGSPFKNVHAIMASAKVSGPESTAESDMRELLLERHRIRPGELADFRVQNTTEIANILGVITGTLTLMLASIAGISLVVGGVGIMNTMLVSVTERTREIGIRMAVGAESKDILRQFLVESVVLSFIGGVIGFLIGVGGSVAMTTAINELSSGADWPIVISVPAAIVAILFAAAVGIFFGFYPALKASRLDPIDALRYE